MKRQSSSVPLSTTKVQYVQQLQHLDLFYDFFMVFEKIYCRVDALSVLHSKIGILLDKHACTVLCLIFNVSLFSLIIGNGELSSENLFQ